MTKPFSLFEQETQATVPLYSVRLVQDAVRPYDGGQLNSARVVNRFLRDVGLHSKSSEEFHVLYLNTRNQVIGMEMISKGTLNASLVHPREVFKGALLANANSLILAHNHPSGNVEPSSADKQVTETLVKAGKLMDVKIIDHLIIGATGGFFSFSDASMIET
jgi:DNA repair protein RadC